MRLKGECKACGRPFVCDDDDDEAGTNLCYICFEDGIERNEERKRRRIAEENEY